MEFSSIDLCFEHPIDDFNTDCNESAPTLIKNSTLLELPDVWKRANSTFYSTKKKILDGNSSGDRKLWKPNEETITSGFHLYHSSFTCISDQNNDTSRFITEAILKQDNKRLTLEEIKKYVFETYGADDSTIETCLCYNKCFKYTVINRTKYWKVSLEYFSKTGYGKNLADTGVVGGFEYWDGHQLLNQDLTR